MTKLPIDSDYFDSSPSPYVLFKKFTSKEAAEELADFLSGHQLAYELEESALNFDLPGAVTKTSKEYRIKLKKNDFEQAQQLLDEYTLKQLDQLDQDYPLFGFTDEELMDVLMKPDEWNTIDPLLAKKILKDRGKEMTTKELAALKEQRLEELSKPEQGQRWWIVVAYLSALFGGLFGILIGWHISSHKKTLPNGDRVYSYSLSDRAHGQYIFILGVICLMVSIGIKILNR